MSEKKNTGKSDQEVEAKKLDEINLESDVRFEIEDDKVDLNVKEDQKVDEKKKRPKIGFGGKSHIKSLKKSRRQEKISKFIRRMKIKFPENLFVTISSGFARFLDYALNIFIIGAIVFSIWMGITALLDDNWIRVLCSGFIVVILTWLNEKII